MNGQNSSSRRLRVFLCHSSADKPPVRKLYARLQQDGFAPWLDEEDLIPGQNWQQEISKAVHACEVVLVCLSKSSVTKEGFVQKEITIALDAADQKPEETIFIIPARLEEGVDVPERLSRWQWVDLYEKRGHQKLLRALTLRSSALGIGEASSESTSNIFSKNQKTKPSTSKSASRSISLSQIGIVEAHSSSVRGVAVTMDGRGAVSASDDKTLKVWDLEGGQELHTLHGHALPVLGVTITTDGRRVVSASRDKTLKVWDLGSGQELHTLKGHSDAVLGVAATPDGRCAVSASYDNTLKVWNLDNGREVLRLSASWFFAAILGVAITPDGQRAVSVSDNGTLKLWDLDSGQKLWTLKGHSNAVSGVAITPDGRCAVSASHDKMLKVWDLDSGQELRTLNGHSDAVFSVAVTPDGRRAISASGDKTLKLWELDSGLLLATFTCEGIAYCCACVSDTRILGGDSDGRMYLLKTEE